MILNKINDLLDLNSMCITDLAGSAICVNFLHMDKTGHNNIHYLIHSLGIAVIQPHTIVSIERRQF